MSETVNPIFKKTPFGIKLVSVIVLHLILIAGYFMLAHTLPFIKITAKYVVFICLFSAVYFTLVWNDLYSKPYHHYLKNAFTIIIRDIFLCYIGMVILECLCYKIYTYVDILTILRNSTTLAFFYFVVHVLQYLWILHLADLGFFSKNVMLVGTYDERLPVEMLFQNIKKTKNFLGQIVPINNQWFYHADMVADLTPISKNLSNFLFSRKVNELIICLGRDMTPEAIQSCASWCRENSIGYYLVPDISSLPHSWPWHNRFVAVPSIERYCPNRDSLIMLSLKRILDILVSGGALLVLSPVMLVVAALIKAEDGGRIFYVSDRVGIHGKGIRFMKFRSMVPNAEKLKQELLAMNERPDGPLFKLSNDPRVTRIGKVLRRTSLDEIPQLWNVFKGDMSLIGPRPHLPSEVAEYSDRDNLRLECIPGISCLPQIYGRDSLGFREWVDYDLEYRTKWSLSFDFFILIKTVKVVFKPLFSSK